MIHVVQEWNADDNRDLLDQMFRMRARVFGARLQWDVACRDGSERDDLDGASPAYLISADVERRVNGCCRLLPTSGPTLLATCFADTLPDAAQLSDSSIWECTRFCVDDGACAPAAGGIGPVTAALVRAAIGLARANGIETILANVNAATVRMCRRAGYRIDVLGVTHRFSPAVYLASFPVAACGAVLDRMALLPEPALPAAWSPAARRAAAPHRGAAEALRGANEQPFSPWKKVS